MNLDSDISNWVLGFCLRQPLDYRSVNSMLRASPPSSDCANLQKLFLLKRLEFDVSLRQVSEIALESMEQLEDLEFRRGNGTVSDAMRWAYCAAAVVCTLKCVKVGHDGGDKYLFFDTVKRIWRLRVGRMKKTAWEVGLRSDMLWDWKDTMEKAVWDDNLRHEVVEKFETDIAVDAVEVYLREESERMAPSFLEEVAEKMKHDKGLWTLMGVYGIYPMLQDQPASLVIPDESGCDPNKVLQDQPASLVIPDESGCNPNKVLQDQPASLVIPDASGCNPNEEMQKRRNILRGKRVARMPSRSSRGAKIADFDETAEGPSCGNASSPLSAEVHRAREALLLSSLELRAALRDPLPDALRLAEAISEGNADAAGVADADAGVVPSNGGNVKTVPKPSLMERNSTARTYEWDDSIDGSEEDLACRAKRRLPSPARLNTSPLRIYETNNVKRRRKGRRWSSAEEDALRAGVDTYGKGNWKVILNANRDAFEGRTEVDLKDKWRNMMR